MKSMRRLGHKRLRGMAALLLAGLVNLNIVGCANLETQPVSSTGAASLPANAAVAAATFGPEGRLWRLLIAGHHVYVDSSGNRGASYSAPVLLNPGHQHIVAKAEDRPAIVADNNGRVAVIYYASEPHPWATWFSYSVDGGKHFSEPRLLSHQAHTHKHYQDLLANSPAGKTYLFWYEDDLHDPRPETGAAFYYSVAGQPEQLTVPDRKIRDGMCQCCRVAVDFDSDGLPVVMARFLFPGNIRDHGVLKLAADGTWSEARVSEDDWRIEACPEHGPALSIAPDGRYHAAWFTQGSKRQGLFYAYSGGQGQPFSAPMAFGDPEALAGHADVLALGDRVVLAWKEFDGDKTRIKAMQSRDRGESWSPATTLAESGAESDHPFLITDQQDIFLSWNVEDRSFQLIPIP